MRTHSSIASPWLPAAIAVLLVACGRSTSPSQPSESASSATATPTPTSAPRRPPTLVEPKRLAELPISAYRTTLALDDDSTYLLSPHAAYRLVPGEPLRGIELE